LIGVNTAIVSPSGASAGIGFAIPVDDVTQVVQELIGRIVATPKKKRGEVQTPRLGVQLAEEKVARELGVADGVLVLKVVPDSPAAAAGVQPTRLDQDGQVLLGDVIVSIKDKDGNKPVKSASDLHAVLQQHAFGDTVTVTVRRGNETKDLQVTLEAAGGG
jgi:S1-C subfamily serine protease